MANVRNGNTFFVDTASNAGTLASFIEEKGIKVAFLSFTSNSIGDTLDLADLSPTSTAAGSDKIVVRDDDATDTQTLNMIGTPMVFPNGLWIKSISAGAKATIVLTSRGG